MTICIFSSRNDLLNVHPDIHVHTYKTEMGSFSQVRIFLMAKIEQQQHDLPQHSIDRSQTRNMKMLTRWGHEVCWAISPWDFGVDSWVVLSSEIGKWHCLMGFWVRKEKISAPNRIEVWLWSIYHIVQMVLHWTR